MPNHSENRFTNFEFLRDKFSELTDEHIKITRRHVLDSKAYQLTYKLALVSALAPHPPSTNSEYI